MNITFQFPFQQEWFNDDSRVKFSHDNAFSAYHLFQVEAVKAVLANESVYYFSDSADAQSQFLYKAYIFAESIEKSCGWIRSNKGLRFPQGKVIKPLTFTPSDLQKAQGYLIIDNLSDRYSDFQQKLINRMSQSDEIFRIIGGTKSLSTKLCELDLISSRSSLLTAC